MAITFEEISKINKTLKSQDIKGKPYIEVPERVKAFRKLFPEGTIDTEMLSCQNGVCIFKATAKNGETILGTGHAYEKEGSTFINKTSYIENCETSAVGRCLGFVGIGIDTSIASYEEVQNAKANQDERKTAKKPDKAALVNRIQELASMKSIPIKELCEQARVKSIADMPESQMEACIKYLEGLG